jgi:hypothetical protein
VLAIALDWQVLQVFGPIGGASPESGLVGELVVPSSQRAEGGNARRRRP